MDRYNAIQFIIDIIKDHNHNGGFSISYLHDHIIVVITLNDHNISRIISMKEVEICRDPNQMVCSIINDMINKLN